ncbi:MAG TPA: sigma 54 modulation/S30EA ribosomal C-terminal domain-containing protein [Mycobacterium sp.]|nr:sigma 54 modulation/S30EA ribosomal C-terminal domain-containing protein [Mycobacterium sp.]
MRRKADLAPAFDIEVIAHGELSGAAEYARRKVSGLGRVTRRPVLFARVKLTKHFDPALARPVIAQANVDVDGRLVRAQVEGVSAREAIDRLEARLRQRLERVAEHWEARRGGLAVTSPGEWRHGSESTHRPSYFPRPEDERTIVRHKAYTLSTCTVEEAALEMDLLDYDFHLFVEEGTNQDSVIYRAGPTGYRLAQAKPIPAERLAGFELPVTISAQPAPRLTVQEAIERLGLLGLPFLFFVDAEQNRGCVLYHRYDGHYGLITAAT